MSEKDTNLDAAYWMVMRGIACSVLSLVVPTVMLLPSIKSKPIIGQIIEAVGLLIMTALYVRLHSWFRAHRIDAVEFKCYFWRQPVSRIIYCVMALSAIIAAGKAIGGYLHQ